MSNGEVRNNKEKLFSGQKGENQISIPINAERGDCWQSYHSWKRVLKVFCVSLIYS